MDKLDFLAFAGLFREAFKKCFAQAFASPMTETEAKIFSNKILDRTGLSIGWKSVKNYSIFIAEGSAARQENPSAATLDTLARYVLDAPYTTEIQRKNGESHYPYWFLYREKFIPDSKKGKSKAPRAPFWIAAAVTVVAGAFITCAILSKKSHQDQFTDNFYHVDDNSMNSKGWFLKSKDAAYWDKRNGAAGRLTLFTLKGDNWPDLSGRPEIKNLLLREIKSDCFTAEVHMDDFVPAQEWQQAGMLILEDTVLTGKSIRLSLAFNDNFGGRKMPSEIYVQVITSLGNGFGKPEELAHRSLFYLDSIRNNPLLVKNLLNSALRIEKHGNRFRFLYSGGVNENDAFREITSQEFDMKPKYIGIFALKGFTSSETVPVRFKLFKLTGEPCN